MAVRPEPEDMKPEPVRPIRIRVCVQCEKDEMLIPLQDCVSCKYSREGDKTVLCSWVPAEKPCEGCGIPAEFCEPETCLIAQAKEKAADVVETAEEYILITF